MISGRGGHLVNVLLVLLTLSWTLSGVSYAEREEPKYRVIVQLVEEEGDQFRGVGRSVALFSDSVIEELSIVNSVVMELTPREIEEISKLPGVKSIQIDRIVYLMGDGEGIAGNVGAEPMWQLGYYGEGVKVCVIDSGIYPVDDALGENKIVEWRKFHKEAPRPTSITHGNYVSRIIAANGTIMGIAPKAVLLDAQAFDPRSNTGYESNVIKAIEWCVSQGADIINMSFGIPSTPYNIDDVPDLPDGEDLMSRAVEEAVKNGAIVVVSAGNYGPGKGTLTTPGCSEYAITVGATYGSNIWDGSSRGPNSKGYPKPEIVAPGVGLPSEYTPTGGTSFSAPHVSGAAALILEAYYKEYGNKLDQIEMKSILVANSIDIGLDPLSYGAGMLHVHNSYSSKLLIRENPVLIYGSKGEAVKKKIKIENLRRHRVDLVPSAFDLVNIYDPNELIEGEVEERTISIPPGDLSYMHLKLDVPEEVEPGIYMGMVSLRQDIASIELSNGEGTLREQEIEMDLNGDSDTSDEIEFHLYYDRLDVDFKDNGEDDGIIEYSGLRNMESFSLGSPGQGYLVEFRGNSLSILITSKVLVSLVIPMDLTKNQETLSNTIKYELGERVSDNLGDFHYYPLKVGPSTRDLRTSLFSFRECDYTEDIELYLFDYMGNLVDREGTYGTCSATMVTQKEPSPTFWTVAVHLKDKSGDEEEYTLNVMTDNLVYVDPDKWEALATITNPITSKNFSIQRIKEISNVTLRGEFISSLDEHSLSSTMNSDYDLCELGVKAQDYACLLKDGTTVDYQDGEDIILPAAQFLEVELTWSDESQDLDLEVWVWYDVNGDGTYVTDSGEVDYDEIFFAGGSYHSIGNEEKVRIYLPQYEMVYLDGSFFKEPTDIEIDVLSYDLTSTVSFQLRYGFLSYLEEDAFSFTSQDSEWDPSLPGYRIIPARGQFKASIDVKESGREGRICGYKEYEVSLPEIDVLGNDHHLQNHREFKLDWLPSEGPSQFYVGYISEENIGEDLNQDGDTDDTFGILMNREDEKEIYIGVDEEAETWQFSREDSLTKGSIFYLSGEIPYHVLELEPGKVTIGYRVFEVPVYTLLEESWLTLLEREMIIDHGHFLENSVEIQNVFDTREDFTVNFSGIGFNATSWVSFLSGNTVTLDPGASHTFPIQVEVPVYTPPGNYTIEFYSEVNGERASDILKVVVPESIELEIIPESDSIEVCQGGSSQTILELRNLGNVQSTFSLNPKPSDPSIDVDLSQWEVTLQPGETQPVTLFINVPATLGEGSYSIEIEATSGEYQTSVEIPFTVSSCQQGGISLSIYPNEIEVGPEETSEFSLTLVNQGDSPVTCSITFESNTISEENGWSITIPEESPEIGPGEEWTFQLRITPPAETYGEFEFKVIARSDGETAEVQGRVRVSSNKVSLVLSQDEAEIQPGSTFSLGITVKNQYSDDKSILVEISGEKTEWLSWTSKDVFLGPGEDETLTLLISPDEEGTYYYDISAYIGGEMEDTKRLTLVVSSGGVVLYYPTEIARIHPGETFKIPIGVIGPGNYDVSYEIVESSNQLPQTFWTFSILGENGLPLEDSDQDGKPDLLGEIFILSAKVSTLSSGNWVRVRVKVESGSNSSQAEFEFRVGQEILEELNCTLTSSGIQVDRAVVFEDLLPGDKLKLRITFENQSTEEKSLYLKDYSSLWIEEISGERSERGRQYLQDEMGWENLPPGDKAVMEIDFTVPIFSRVSYATMTFSTDSVEKNVNVQFNPSQLLVERKGPIILTGEDFKEALPGEMVLYEIKAWNLGNVPLSVNLASNLPQGWELYALVPFEVSGTTAALFSASATPYYGVISEEEVGMDLNSNGKWEEWTFGITDLVFPGIYDTLYIDFDLDGLDEDDKLEIGSSTQIGEIFYLDDKGSRFLLKRDLDLLGGVGVSFFISVRPPSCQAEVEREVTIVGDDLIDEKLRIKVIGGNNPEIVLYSDSAVMGTERFTILDVGVRERGNNEEPEEFLLLVSGESGWEIKTSIKAEATSTTPPQGYTDPGGSKSGVYKYGVFKEDVDGDGYPELDLNSNGISEEINFVLVDPYESGIYERVYMDLDGSNTFYYEFSEGSEINNSGIFVSHIDPSGEFLTLSNGTPLKLSLRGCEELKVTLEIRAPGWFTYGNNSYLIVSLVKGDRTFSRKGILITSGMERDIGISGLELSESRLRPGEILRISTKVKNYGTKKETDIGVRARLGDMVSYKEIPYILPGEEREVALDVRVPDTQGNLSGNVQIVFPQDQNPSNNSRAISVVVEGKVEIWSGDLEVGQALELGDYIIRFPRMSAPTVGPYGGITPPGRVMVEVYYQGEMIAADLLEEDDSLRIELRKSYITLVADDVDSIRGRIEFTLYVDRDKVFYMEDLPEWTSEEGEVDEETHEYSVRVIKIDPSAEEVELSVYMDDEYVGRAIIQEGGARLFESTDGTENAIEVQVHQIKKVGEYYYAVISLFGAPFVEDDVREIRYPFNPAEQPAQQFGLPQPQPTETTPKEPRVSLNFEVSTTELFQGRELLMIIDVRNEGEGVAKALEVNLNVPQGLYISKGEKTIFTDLPPGDKIRKAISIRAEEPGTYSIVADIKYKDEEGNEYTDSREVYILVSEKPSPSIEVRKEISSQSLGLDEELVVKVTVVNRGKGEADDVRITDPIPEGLNISYGKNTAYASSLGPGGELKVTYSLRASKPGNYRLGTPIVTYTFEGKTFEARGNSFLVSFTTTPEISASKTVEPAEIRQGEELTSVIVVSNVGDVPVKIRVVDPVPNGFSGEPLVEEFFLEEGKTRKLIHRIRAEKTGKLRVDPAIIKYGEEGLEFETSTEEVTVNVKRPPIGELIKRKEYLLPLLLLALIAVALLLISSRNKRRRVQLSTKRETRYSPRRRGERAVAPLRML